MPDLELRRKLAEIAGWAEIQTSGDEDEPGDDLFGKPPPAFPYWDVEPWGHGFYIVPPYEESVDVLLRDLGPILREKGLDWSMQSATEGIMADASHADSGLTAAIETLAWGTEPYPEALALARAVVAAMEGE